MQPPFFKTLYNHDRDQESNDTGIAFDPDEGLTIQHFRDECDINTIVKRFGLTGELPQNLSMPTYGDFRGISDYQTALNLVMEANRNFMTLPAELRARFENDPQQLLAFLDDEKNRAEAIELGLVKAPPPAPPPPAEGGSKA